MIPLANAPCSWGMLELDDASGSQLGYTQMLDELYQAGYVGTELGDWGFMPTDPAALRVEIERRGLSMLGAFVPVAFKNPAAHRAGRDQAVRTARLLAAVADINRRGRTPYLILADTNGDDPARTLKAGRVTPDLGLSVDEWRTFAQGVSTTARAVRDETGLQTLFHPHSAGFVETPDETARLLDATDPDLVNIVFDTGHYAYSLGSNDPPGLLAGLDRFADRIKHIHFKDCHPDIATRARSEGWDYLRAVRDGLFCELGKGLVDFPSVTAWLRQRSYDGWIVVEQDVLPGLGTPRESAIRNRQYLATLGL